GRPTSTSRSRRCATSTASASSSARRSWPAHLRQWRRTRSTSAVPSRPLVMARASYRLDHLDELEAEGIHILREVAAQFERPAILFSGGKDSVVVVHLARKAFWPARMPFPLLHIDTGHNFPETIAFRDELVATEG